MAMRRYSDAELSDMLYSYADRIRSMNAEEARGRTDFDDYRDRVLLSPAPPISQFPTKEDDKS